MRRNLAAAFRRRARSRGGLRRGTLIALCAICAVLAAAATAAADPTPVGSPFDGSGTPDGSMLPTKVAVDEATGDVYVIDAAHDAVNKFSSTGTYLSQIKGSDTTAGSFSFGGNSTDAVAVDNSSGGDGSLYVVSESGGITFKFDSTGSESWEVPSSGKCGVSVDSGGNPWTADFFASALVQLRVADGGATGTTLNVSPLTPCAIAFDKNDDVLVTNWNSNLDKWDLAGNDLSQCASSSVSTYAVATDSLTGDVFGIVQDSAPHLKQWDSSCSPLSTVDFPFAGFGSYPGVAVNGPGRLVYASEPDQGAVQIYAMPPTVTPGAPTNIGVTSVTLNGTVNPGGAPVTDCHFDVATDRDFANIVATVPCVPSNLGTGTDPVPVRADVTGLTANTPYHSRLVAANVAASSRTGDVTFRTLAPSPPTVTTGTATGVTETAATLNGTANPNRAATTCKFQYGTTPSYGLEIATASPGSGSGNVAVNANVAGLAAGTLYHFRLVCTNGGGTRDGVDGTFRTQDVPITDRCVTDPASCQPPPVRTCSTDASLCRVTLAVVSGLRVTCTGDTGGACRSTLTFRAKVRYKVKRGRRTVTKTRTITVGRATVDLAVGGSSTLRISLTSAAKSALKKSALSATADGLDGAVKLPKTKVRRHKHKRK